MTKVGVAPEACARVVRSGEEKPGPEPARRALKASAATRSLGLAISGVVSAPGHSLLSRTPRQFEASASACGRHRSLQELQEPAAKRDLFSSHLAFRRNPDGHPPSSIPKPGAD